MASATRNLIDLKSGDATRSGATTCHCQNLSLPSLAWYSYLSVQLKARLAILISKFSKIVGQMVEPNFHELYKKKMLTLTGKIMSDSSHILNEEYQLLPLKRRLRVPYARLNRFVIKVHQSVK